MDVDEGFDGEGMGYESQFEIGDLAQTALAEIELCLGIFEGGAGYSKFAREFLVGDMILCK